MRDPGLGPLRQDRGLATGVICGRRRKQSIQGWVTESGAAAACTDGADTADSITSLGSDETVVRLKRIFAPLIIGL